MQTYTKKERFCENKPLALANSFSMCFDRVMAIDSVYRDKVGKDLTLRLTGVMEKEQITQEESRVIADVILTELDKVQTQEQMLQFLSALSQKWPFFSDVLTLEKGVAQIEEEGRETVKVEELIKENKIDEALETIKAATVAGGGV